MTKKSKVALLIFMLMFAGSALAAGVVAFTGQPTWSMQSSWNLHPMGDESYTESWLFVSRTDEGGFIFCTFMISNAGLGDFNPGVAITYYTPEGKIFSNDFKMDEEHLHYAQSGLNLRVDDLRLWKQGNVVRMVIPRGKVLLDLTLRPTVQPWRQGSGVLELGNSDDTWNWAVSLPRARISGTVTAGGKTIDAAGWGYLDHTWSNQAFFDFSSNWNTLRVHGAKRTFNFLQIVASKKLGRATARSLMMAEDGKPVRATSKVKYKVLSTLNRNGYTHPKEFIVQGNVGGVQVTLEARNGRYGEAIDPLRSLSGIERTAIRALVTKPQMYRVIMDTKVTVVENGMTETEDLGAIGAMLYFAQ